MQHQIADLATLLIGAGYRVMIETSGTHSVAALPPEVVRIVDVKTPASGESGRMHPEVLEGLGPRDAVKFVICDEADYHWAAELVRTRKLSARTEVLLSPAHGQVDPKDLVAWMLRDGLDARLNLQLHKYIWSADARGV